MSFSDESQGEYSNWRSEKKYRMVDKTSINLNFAFFSTKSVRLFPQKATKCFWKSARFEILSGPLRSNDHIRSQTNDVTIISSGLASNDEQRSVHIVTINTQVNGPSPHCQPIGFRFDAPSGWARWHSRRSLKLMAAGLEETMTNCNGWDWIWYWFLYVRASGPGVRTRMKNTEIV